MSVVGRLRSFVYRHFWCRLAYCCSVFSFCWSSDGIRWPVSTVLCLGSRRSGWNSSPMTWRCCITSSWVRSSWLRFYCLVSRGWYFGFRVLFEWRVKPTQSTTWTPQSNETPPTHNNRSCAGGVWRVAAVVYSSRSETSYRSVTAHVLDSLINFVQERFESLNWTWSLIIQLPERSFLVRGNTLLLPSYYKRVFLARGSISA